MVHNRRVANSGAGHDNKPSAKLRFTLVGYQGEHGTQFPKIARSGPQGFGAIISFPQSLIPSLKEVSHNYYVDPGLKIYTNHLLKLINPTYLPY